VQLHSDVGFSLQISFENFAKIARARPTELLLTLPS
jgi:hypothetical protein